MTILKRKRLRKPQARAFSFCIVAFTDSFLAFVAPRRVAFTMPQRYCRIVRATLTTGASRLRVIQLRSFLQSLAASSWLFVRKSSAAASLIRQARAVFRLLLASEVNAASCGYERSQSCFVRVNGLVFPCCLNARCSSARTLSSALLKYAPHETGQNRFSVRHRGCFPAPLQCRHPTCPC